jgi:hypothetical protein
MKSSFFSVFVDSFIGSIEVRVVLSQYFPLIFRFILVYIGLYWFILVYIGLYWFILVIL